jgi:hypothetical protein
LAAALPVSAACSKEPAGSEIEAAASASVAAASAAAAPTEELVRLSTPPTPEERAQASALAATATEARWAFLVEKETQSPTPRLALLVAATKNSNPALGAALHELAGQRTLDPALAKDLATVVRHHIHSRNPRLAARAMAAAKPLLTGASPEDATLDKVLEIATSAPFETSEGRWATLDAVAVVNRAKRPAALKRILSRSLKDSSPGVVIAALELLYSPRLAPRADAALTAELTPLLSHYDAGVRGVAATALGKNGKDQAPALDGLLRALSDEHPFVRAKASEALSGLSYGPSVHDLVKLASDYAAPNYSYTVNTFDKNGLPQQRRGAHWPHVAAAAQDALLKIGHPELKLEQVQPKDPKASLTRNAAAIRSWYAANKAKHPAHTFTTEAAKAADAPAATDSVDPGAAAAEEPAADQSIATRKAPVAADKPAAATVKIPAKAPSNPSAKTVAPPKPAAPAKPPAP